MSTITLPYSISNGDALDADKVMANENAIVTEYNASVAALSGSVVSTTETQTLTNKTLTSPKINENVAVTSTATEINFLHGLADVVSSASSSTLTNKRITKRTNTSVTAASHTINSDTTDMFTVTAQAEAVTFNAPSGSPTSGQTLILRVKDDGTARGITWNAIFRASSDLALPTTTIISKTLYCGFIYNTTDTKWDLIAYLDNF